MAAEFPHSNSISVTCRVIRQRAYLGLSFVQLVLVQGRTESQRKLNSSIAIGVLVVVVNAIAKRSEQSRACS